MGNDPTEPLRDDDLGRILNERGPLPGIDVARHLQQIARALEAIHAAGQAHRDLRPDSIVITADGGVRLRDPSTGDPSSGADPRKAQLLAAPLYLAPEQVRGEEKIGPRTDVYGLGHVAYALLVGEPYFQVEKEESDAAFHLLGCVVGGAREPAGARAERRCGVSLPTAFDAWFRRATAVDVNGRFATASAAADAFAEALDAPVSSRASSLLPGSRSSSVPPSLRPPAPDPHDFADRPTIEPGAALAHLLETVPNAPGEASTTPQTPPAAPSAPEADPRRVSLRRSRNLAAPLAAGAVLVVLVALIVARETGLVAPSPSADPARRPTAVSAAPTGTAASPSSPTTARATSASPAQPVSASALASASSSAAPAAPSSSAASVQSVSEAASSAAAPAPGGVGACAVALFPSDTFAPGTSPDFGYLCSETDPRKGAATTKTRVVLGSSRSFTGGKLEWGVLGWYEMATFAVIRATCCAEPAPLKLPPMEGGCALEERLNEVAAAALAAAGPEDEKLRAKVAELDKSLSCAQRSNTEMDVFVWKDKVAAGEQPAFWKTVARVLAARAGSPR